MDSTSNVSVRDGLIRMRDDVLKRLHALARSADRKEADRLYGELQVLERAAQSTADDGGYKYARHKSAVMAILAYLDEAEHPVLQKQLIDDLVKGGFRMGNDNAETNLKQSIAAFTNGPGRKTKQIKIVNGMIGRGDWDDSLFVK